MRWVSAPFGSVFNKNEDISENNSMVSYGNKGTVMQITISNAKVKLKLPTVIKLGNSDNLHPRVLYERADKIATSGAGVFN